MGLQIRSTHSASLLVIVLYPLMLRARASLLYQLLIFFCILTPVQYFILMLINLNYLILKISTKYSEIIFTLIYLLDLFFY